MSRASEQFEMDLPIEDANAASHSAVSGLGWSLKSADASGLRISIPQSATKWETTIDVRLKPMTAGSTTITLDAKIGQLAGGYLRRQMSKLREAIADNAEGISLRDCKVLGGHGHEIAPGTACTVLFRAEEVQVIPVAGDRVTFSYGDVAALEVGGKGIVRSGGGFVGGGFGAEGAAVGIGAASVLNTLTSTTSIDTVLNIKGRDRQVWLHYPREAPQALNVRLSGVIAKIERAQPAAPIAPTASVTEELARLHELHAQGALTDEEYSEAKGRLIERL